MNEALKTLEKLKSDLEEIAGEWNGDEPGLLEDRAHIALEAIESVVKAINQIEEVKGILKQLSDY